MRENLTVEVRKGEERENMKGFENKELAGTNVEGGAEKDACLPHALQGW